jgi:hypothetical protein
MISQRSPGLFVKWQLTKRLAPPVLEGSSCRQG